MERDFGREAVWFITGTGTDVGKTVVTAALLRALRGLGVDCQAVKAVQTGCDIGPDDTLRAPDTDVYRRAAGDAPVHAPVRFAPPCSPQLAAESAGVRISAIDICQKITALAEGREFTLVEGAGGLLVPVNEHESIADIIHVLGARVILVAANRLGAINETLLTLEAAGRRGLAVEAVVFSAVVPVAGASALEKEIRRDNIETLRRKAGPLPVFEIDHVEGLRSGDAAMEEAAWIKTAASMKPLAESMLKTGQPAIPDKHKGGPDFDARHLWHPYAPTHPSPEVWHVKSTWGNRIRLSDGRELIDGMSSWWSAVHGYNHPRLLAALHRQANRMPHVMFGGLTHEPAIELGKRLIAMAPDGLDRVFFADSGSVAVEVALKMALQYHHARGDAGRVRFVAPLGGYHGDTQGAMSVCDPVGGMHGLFSGTLPEQLFVQRPSCRFDAEYDTESVRGVEEIFRRRGNEIAAFIAEPVVQGAGGMWFYHPRYLCDVRRICDEHGALLILDEIATGFGRTGRLFACEWAGVPPDILCLGKALTGGTMTLAAVLARDGIARTISERGVFMHGPTFMANPLACAVAGASLDLLSEGGWQTDVRRLEQALRRGLEPCRGMPGVADVRVLGAIGVVEMEQPVNTSTLQPFFVERGVWLRPFSRLIYLMPPYITSEDDADRLTSALVSAVEQRKWI